MKRWYKGMTGIAIAALLVAGCGQPKEDSPTSGSQAGAATASGSAVEVHKLRIVASFYPIAEFARQVAGEYADVVSLIPSGTEPHDWEPTPKDAASIQEADVFVYNGIVEGWAEKTLESVKNDKRIDVKAIEGIDLIEGTHDHGHGHEDEHDHEHDHDHEHGDKEDHGHEDAHEDEHAHENEHAHEGEDVQAEGHEHEKHAHESEPEHTYKHAELDEHSHELDPHVWLDPTLAQQQVRNIQGALEKADPERKDNYRANADAYIAKLQELDRKFKDELDGAKRKEFVTQHAAFGYLAKAYGLTQIPISGLSPEQEPSPEQMAKVVELAKEHGVTTIFFETLVDPKVAQAIAEEIGAATDVLNPLEGLTEEDIAAGLDYLGIMSNNLAALAKSLKD